MLCLKGKLPDANVGKRFHGGKWLSETCMYTLPVHNVYVNGILYNPCIVYRPPTAAKWIFMRTKQTPSTYRKKLFGKGSS